METEDQRRHIYSQISNPKGLILYFSGYNNSRILKIRYVT